jgi:hypothetical protein
MLLQEERDLDCMYSNMFVLYSFGISVKDLELDLPSLYWISKLHKCPCKHRYVYGSAKCSTKPLSKLLTHKNNIVRGLVDGNKNIFVMEERQVFTLTLVYIKCNSLGFLRKNIEVSNRFTKCQTSGIHWEPGIICLALEHPRFIPLSELFLTSNQKQDHFI